MDKAEIAARKAEILAELLEIIGKRLVPADYLEACIFGYDRLEWERLVALGNEYRQLHEAE